jgi:hypothetical protein
LAILDFRFRSIGFSISLAGIFRQPRAVGARARKDNCLENYSDEQPNDGSRHAAEAQEE